MGDWKFPPKTLDDPSDSKPSDWVDEAMIDDPEDKQPEDWDMRKKIDDPSATKPDNWDDDEDGEWEPPKIDNPDYKGDWYAKRIDNPAYKGVWKAKQVPNEKFVENVYSYDDIGSVGYELWTVTRARSSTTSSSRTASTRPGSTRMPTGGRSARERRTRRT